MLSMDSIREIVYKNVNIVLNDSDMASFDRLTDETNFIDNLGFSSLMIAQLIMLVQDEIDLEPFSEKYAISDILTVGGFCNSYYFTMNECEKNNVR